MTDLNYAQLVKQLVDDNSNVQNQARHTLIMLDEDAVSPLVDEFYAGVTDNQGIAILKVIADIGGPDAMSTLRSVFHFEEQRLMLKQTAAEGLLHNRHSLSPKEIIEIKSFLSA